MGSHTTQALFQNIGKIPVGISRDAFPGGLQVARDTTLMVPAPCIGYGSDGEFE